MALDPVRRFASSRSTSSGSTSSGSGSVGIRIGDAEREQAVQSLGEHLRAGRLNVVEYDERLEQAFAARTHAELTPLFADLPGGAPRSGPTPPTGRRDRRAYLSVPIPIRAVVVLALIAGAIVWTILTAIPPLFLIPLLWIFLSRRFGPRRHYGPRRGYGPRGRYDYAGPRRY